jgi:hypothetical protein
MENHMSIFEALMLLFFGMAWPFSIYKSFISRTNKGKSLLFLTVAFLGYLFGILHKTINDRDLVIYLYMLNINLVLIDMLLYTRNYFLEKGGR